MEIHLRVVVFMISLAFPFGACMAQSILKSSVHDEAGSAIFSAAIRILTPDSIFVQGKVTDDKGNFQIEGLKPGDYILQASSIGYKEKSIGFRMPDFSYTLPSIILQTDKVMLDEVVVTGSTFIQKNDHLLVLPDKQQIKHSFSGYDLLYNLMIPGLNIDRKNKTVTAMTGEATLYINGVEADVKDVQNLQPKDIEKVEFYVLPASGKFMGMQLP